MSDFNSVDINDLLHGDEKPKETDTEKVTRMLLEHDRRLLKGFEERGPVMRYPEPVRKRHLR